jgi:hypothetical protein
MGPARSAKIDESLWLAALNGAPGLEGRIEFANAGVNQFQARGQLGGGNFGGQGGQQQPTRGVTHENGEE